MGSVEEELIHNSMDEAIMLVKTGLEWKWNKHGVKEYSQFMLNYPFFM